MSKPHIFSKKKRKKKNKKPTAAAADTSPLSSPLPEAEGGGGESSIMEEYPYEVDYNDHFETPLVAYQDILPLLDLLARLRGDNGHRSKGAVGDGGGGDEDDDDDEQSVLRRRSRQTIYDPYYCAGRSARLLASLGFDRVQHDKRDFYRDVESDTVPDHDALVTNPPYSFDHKERCLSYAVDNLRTNGRPFFLLVPNYVAIKEYYRRAVGIVDGGGSASGGRGEQEPDDVVYVVPPTPYEYDHPQGTGHAAPPFESIWLCGIGRDAAREADAAFRASFARRAARRREDDDGAGGSDVGGSGGRRGGPRLVRTVAELRRLGAVPTAKRGNPRQRRKKRQLAVATNAEAGAAITTTTAANGNGGRPPSGISREVEASDKMRKRKKKKSLYRDAKGIRKKRRF